MLRYRLRGEQPDLFLQVCVTDFSKTCLNFLKDVEIDKFSEASNKTHYGSIYDYENEIVNNWKYNGF